MSDEDMSIGEYYHECGFAYGYHSNGVPRLPWEDRSPPRSRNSTPSSSPSPPPRPPPTTVYWVAGACVDGVGGCAYVFYENDAKENGLSKEMWKDWVAEPTKNTAEIRAVYQCIYKARSAGKSSVFINTASQYIHDCLSGNYAENDINATKIKELLSIVNAESDWPVKVGFAIVRAGTEISKAEQLAKLAARKQ